MRAGQLRHKVALQRATVTADAAGQPTKTWATYATVYAEILPLSGREMLAAQRIQSELDTNIRIRYRADVATTDRVVYGSTTYEVSAPPINTSGRSIELILPCKVVA